MEAKTLALYLGCRVQITTKEATFTKKFIGLYYDSWFNQKQELTIQVEFEDGRVVAYRISEIKLLLRPLSSMTEEEGKEYAGLFFEDYNPELTKFYNFGHCISIRYYDAFLHLPDEYTPKQFHWLLSKHFDLFGLIEKGEAIDSTVTV